MKKHLLLLPLLALLISGCNPNFSDSSEGGGASTTPTSESGAPTGSSGAEETSDEDEDSSEVPPAPTDKTIEELCDEMNAKLATKTNLFDPFDARDYLVSEGFEYLVGEQKNHEFFGYDYVDNKIVVYSMNGYLRKVRYPSSSSTHEVVSYQTKNVSSYTELKESLINVSIGIGNYSTLKITSDIVLTPENSNPVINYEYPVEFDLNNKTIKSTYDSDIIKLNDTKAIVYIKNGAIETFQHDEYDIETSPAAIRVDNAKSIRIDNVNFKSKAFCGYGYINDYGYTGNTLIENCQGISGVTNAICVQGGTNTIRNCKIDGVVNINGGTTVVDNCEITAVGRHDDATAFIDNDFVVNRAQYYFDNLRDRYGTYILSSVDPIIVFDRRSFNHTYSVTNVTVKNSKLTPDYDSSRVYGYGFRYIDLQYDDQKSNPGTIILENNTYPKCNASNPEEAVGGFSKYTAS